MVRTIGLALGFAHSLAPEPFFGKIMPRHIDMSPELLDRNSWVQGS